MTRDELRPNAEALLDLLNDRWITRERLHAILRDFATRLIEMCDREEAAKA